MTSNNQGVAGSPNQNVPHPNGQECYGLIPEMLSRGERIPEGEIFLRVGKHNGPNKGFGVRHIWAEHEKELTKMGYNTIHDVAAMSAILSDPAPKYIVSSAARLAVIVPPS